MIELVTQATPVSCESGRAAKQVRQPPPMPKKMQAKAAASGAARQTAAVAPVDLKDPALYVNRELSLLAFQRRVLEEAEDETNPLLERVKFLSILGSNLDEFFMVRVAGLAAQLEAGSLEAGADGMSPRAQLVAIRREVKRLLAEAHRTLERLLGALREQGILDLERGGLRPFQTGERVRQERAHPVAGEPSLAVDFDRPRGRII